MFYLHHIYDIVSCALFYMKMLTSCVSFFFLLQHRVLLSMGKSVVSAYDIMLLPPTVY